MNGFVTKATRKSTMEENKIKYPDLPKVYLYRRYSRNNTFLASLNTYQENM